jgi:hypothetical protein
MDILPILRQDFKAWTLAHAENRYDLMIVFANRFLSNMLFGDQRFHATVGFVLRDVGVGNLKAQQSGSDAQVVVRDATDNLIESLSALISVDKLDLVATWRAYHRYVSATRLAFASTSEKDSYKENMAPPAALDRRLPQHRLNRVRPHIAFRGSNRVPDPVLLVGLGGA